MVYGGLNHESDLLQVIRDEAVSTVFQPICDLSSGQVSAFEAASRSGGNSPFQSPLALFETAARFGQLVALDRVCNQHALERYVRFGCQASLFLNCTPDSFIDRDLPGFLESVVAGNPGITTDRVVIEITEQQPIDDFNAIRIAAGELRRRGFRIAVDDLGAGFAGLRVWTEINPDYVKIDRHFVEQIDQEAIKRDFVRSVVEMSRGLGCRVVAEGIETVEELATLRRLGIGWGQGFLLGGPRAKPTAHAPEVLRQLILADSEVRTLAGETAGVLARRCLTLTPQTAAEVALEHFQKDRSLMAIPIVDGQRIFGMLTRLEILEMFSARYVRELRGRKPVSGFVTEAFVCVDEHAPLAEVAQRVAEASGPELVQDFVVTRRGDFMGLAKTADLLQGIAGAQIQTARHSNPLTLLPANVPISEQLQRLLDIGTDFHIASVDLTPFKAFNDAYGFGRGDAVILRLAEILRANVSMPLDFLGHRGGDSFVILFRSVDWERRCQAICTAFAEAVPMFFPADALEARGFLVADAAGRPAFHPLLELVVGVASPDLKICRQRSDVEALVASARIEAKRSQGQKLHVSTRRAPRPMILSAGPCLASGSSEQ